MSGARRLLACCACIAIVGSGVVCDGRRTSVRTCRVAVFAGGFSSRRVVRILRRRKPEDWNLGISPNVGSAFVGRGHIGSGDRLDHWVVSLFFDSRRSHGRVALLRWHGWSVCPRSACLPGCSFPGIFSWKGVHCLLTLYPARRSVLIPSRHSFKSFVTWQAPPPRSLRSPCQSTHIDIVEGLFRLSVIQGMPSLMAWISASRMSAYGPMLPCPSWIVVVGFVERMCYLAEFILLREPSVYRRRVPSGRVSIHAMWAAAAVLLSHPWMLIWFMG